jgi:hypothetical protein
MQLAHLSRLEFLDDGFRYKGETFDYHKIEGISYVAVYTQHSVNFLPAGNSYAAELQLYLAGSRRLNIRQEQAFFGSSQKVRVEAVWRAKEIFSELTFSNRLRRYEEQLRAKRFFSYGHHQFHQDGSVFKDGRYLFSVKDEARYRHIA